MQGCFFVSTYCPVYWILFIHSILNYIRGLIKIIAIILTVATTSCTSGGNDNIIPRDEFINILAELHFYDAVLTERGLYDRKLKDSTESYYNYILIKRNMSRSRFDSSLAYYAQDLGKFEKMYDQVIEKLKYREDDFKRRQSIFNLPTRVQDSIISSNYHSVRGPRKREIWTKKRNWSIPKDGRLNIISFEKKIHGQATFELSGNYKVYPDDKTIKLTMLIYIFYSDGSNSTIVDRDFKRDGRWHTHKITAKTILSKRPVKIICKIIDHNTGTNYKHIDVRNISLKQQPVIVPKIPFKLKSKKTSHKKESVRIIEKQKK